MTNTFFAPGKVAIRNVDLNIVDSFTHLDQIISTGGYKDTEITRRVKLAQSTFGRVHTIVKSSFLICLKFKTFNRGVVTYGSET